MLDCESMTTAKARQMMSLIIIMLIFEWMVENSSLYYKDTMNKSTFKHRSHFVLQLLIVVVLLKYHLSYLRNFDTL